MHDNSDSRISSAVAYFNFYLPSRVIVFGAMAIFLLWFFAPIDYVVFESWQPYAILALYSLIFYASMYLFCGLRRGRVVRCEINVPVYRRLVNFIFMIGFIGLTIRIVDRVFMRAGGQISLDFMANRQVFAAEGGGILALLGGVLSSFLLFLPAFIAASRMAGEKRLRHWLMLLFCCVYALFDMLLQGSRSGVVIFVSVVMLSLLVTRYVRVRPFSALCIFGLAVVTVWAAGMLFWIRTTQMGLDPIASMSISGYAKFAAASPGLIDYLGKEGVEGMGGLVYAFTHLSQYMTHGVYEFFYITESVEEPATYGMLSFYIPVKIWFVSIGGGGLEVLLQDAQLRPGVYTTLFGPLYYDFGLYGGLVACAFFGAVVGRVSRNLMNGNFAFLPMYLLFVTFVAYFPVVNLFVSGTGQYSIFSACLLWLSIRLFYRRALSSTSARTVQLENRIL